MAAAAKANLVYSGTANVYHLAAEPEIYATVNHSDDWQSCEIVSATDFRQGLALGMTDSANAWISDKTSF